MYAGQQKTDGDESPLTGQLDKYKNRWPSTVGTMERALSDTGLIHPVLASGVYAQRNTFVGLVFDSQFDYWDFSWKKSAILCAHVQYVSDKMGPRTTSIFLVGHSRGGCLVMRMAAMLSELNPTVAVIIIAYDPICVVPGLMWWTEFGVTDKMIRNPLKPSYKVHTTNMTEQLQVRKCLAVRSYLCGDRVFLFPVRSFGHVGFDKQKQSLALPGGREWYTQSFHIETHNGIDDLYHNTTVAYLRKVVRSIGCGCSSGDQYKIL